MTILRKENHEYLKAGKRMENNPKICINEPYDLQTNIAKTKTYWNNIDLTIGKKEHLIKLLIIILQIIKMIIQINYQQKRKKKKNVASDNSNEIQYDSEFASGYDNETFDEDTDMLVESEK